MKHPILTLLFLFIANIVSAQCTAPSINSQPLNDTICAGSNAIFSVGASGTGLTYQWYLASSPLVNGGVYSGVTTNTLQITGATASMSGNQYKCIVSGTCSPAATSNIVTLYVNTLVAITTQPQNDSVCSASNATFSLAATGTNLSYQWQENSGAGFSNLSNSSIYSGVTSNTLTITSTTASMNNYRYKCIVTGTCGSPVNSIIDTLVVIQSPASVSISSNSPLCAGDILILTATCTTAGIHYWWGANIALLFGQPGDTSTWQINNVSSYYATTYTVVTYITVGSLTCYSPNSASTTISVYSAPNPTVSSHNINVCLGSPLYIGATATGATGYIWNPTPTVTNPPINSQNVFIASAVYADSGIYVVHTYQTYSSSLTCNSQSSDTAHVDINPQSPIITYQPTPNIACACGGPVAFTIGVIGASLTFQWYHDTVQLTNGNGYSGVNTGVLYVTVSGLAAAQAMGGPYHCVVYGSCSTTPAISNNALLTSNTPPQSFPLANDTVCAGSNANFSIPSGSPFYTFSYLWEVDTGNGWQVWYGLNSNNFTINNVTSSMNGYKFRCWVNNSCCSIMSDSAGLVVNTAPSIATQPLSVFMCPGGNATFSLSATGTTLTYQWYLWSTAPTAITNNSLYSGATTDTLTFTSPTPSNNGYYQCQVSGTCGTINSNIDTFAVLTPISITSQPIADTICNNDNAGFRVLATGTGLTYQWQADTGSGFYSLSDMGVYTGVSTDSLTITSAGSSMDSFRYRCHISGPCGSSASNTVLLRVNVPVNISISGNVLSTGLFPNYQWVLNNVIIPGATSQSFLATASGCYTVIVSPSSTATCFSSPYCTPYCSGDTTQFTASVSSLSASFTTGSTAPASWQNLSFFWNFGDGGTDTVMNPSHTYSSANTYNVTLITNWMDTATSTAQCSDTFTQAVVVGNIISGNISIDTASANPSAPAFQVWLIVYDSMAQTLTAVDSVTDTGSSYMAYYQFINEPAGAYLVKAMITNGPTTGIGPVPTYGLDSLHWSGATQIFYSGSGASINNNIIMQQDSVTSGPGFIGGNVTQGANKGTKGTGAPVDSMLIFLRGANNHFIKHTYTDANGNYSFGNLALGSYIVYPEEMNYATLPQTNILLNAANPSNGNISFQKHTLSKTITPLNTAVQKISTVNNIRVFPNPSTGILHILCEQSPQQKMQAIITDLVGHKLSETTISTAHTLIDLSQLESGIYFINIRGDNINYVQKIVLQR